MQASWMGQWKSLGRDGAATGRQCSGCADELEQVEEGSTEPGEPECGGQVQEPTPWLQPGLRDLGQRCLMSLFLLLK